jgi:predicted metalloprotease with PDZ domain
LFCLEIERRSLAWRVGFGLRKSATMPLAFALLFAAVARGEAPTPITYIVTYPGTAAGRLRVEIELPPLLAPRVLVIPRAIPMGYVQESYDRFVSSVEAFASDGKALAVERGDGPRWLIRGPGEIRRVAYEVDLSRMEKETPAADSASKARDRKAVVDLRFRQTLAEAPGFLRLMSTVELSLIASTQYTRDFRTGSNSFARGGLMAAEMDEAIRSRTGGRRRFRDALRHLVAWSAKERRAFRIDELPRILRAGTGVDIRAILEKWLRPQELPFGRKDPNGK